MSMDLSCTDWSFAWLQISAGFAFHQHYRQSVQKQIK